MDSKLLAQLTHTFLDTNSFEAQKFIGMGFTRGRVRVVGGEPFPNMLRIQVDFTCVCGRTETYGGMMRPEDITKGGRTLYQELERIGSMSRKHLLEDGYTSEQVDDMERRCEQHLERDGRWHIAFPRRIDVSCIDPYADFNRFLKATNAP